MRGNAVRIAGTLIILLALVGFGGQGSKIGAANSLIEQSLGQRCNTGLSVRYRRRCGHRRRYCWQRHAV